MTNYSRLLSGNNHAFFSANALMDLAGTMESTGDDALFIQDTPAGMVYFGQFIDHDLTRDETRLSEAGKLEPEKMTNFRSPALDLDSIYGRGPAAERADTSTPPALHLYDHSNLDAEVFRLGTAIPDEGSTGPAPKPGSDLPRFEGRAVIADDRNDENLIIAQLTLLFLKFHNAMVKLLRQNPPLIQDCGGDTVFAKARRLTVWHYQYLVLENFLDAVLLDEVFKSVFENPKYKPILGFAPAVDTPVNLPVEFTMAAFRFGHSMVRNTYTLNAGPAKHLHELLRWKPAPLLASEIIDWEEFFPSSSRNLALRIDSTLAKALFRLPPDVVKLFTRCSPTGTLVLPARTLMRGSATGLPSGQQLCQELRWDPVEILPGDFAKGSPDYGVLEKNGFLTKTPLWYYILHEAWVAGSDRTLEVQARTAGLLLGPLGSRIVAEVFLGVLKSDRNSFFFAKRDWRPPKPQIEGLSEVTSLMRLVRLVDAVGS